MSGAVTRALKGSYLEPKIRAGIQAVPPVNRTHVAESLRTAFHDSLDLDEATQSRHPTDARWDYLLGHVATDQVVALETHSAETSQVSLVIEKRAAARRHLEDHLRPGETVVAWYWAASGRVDFAPHEKMITRLNQNGIQFVGGRLEAKHLAALPKRAVRPAPRRPKSRR
jgi:hypothetical protein